MPFFPINLPKIDPQPQSLYREECAQYEVELKARKAAEPRWWRRLGMWLRPE